MSHSSNRKGTSFFFLKCDPLYTLELSLDHQKLSILFFLLAGVIEEKLQSFLLFVADILLIQFFFALLYLSLVL